MEQRSKKEKIEVLSYLKAMIRRAAENNSTIFNKDRKRFKKKE